MDKKKIKIYIDENGDLTVANAPEYLVQALAKSLGKLAQKQYDMCG
jgi:biopolymer transport protein ExbD